MIKRPEVFVTAEEKFDWLYFIFSSIACLILAVMTASITTILSYCVYAVFFIPWFGFSLLVAQIFSIIGMFSAFVIWIVLIIYFNSAGKKDELKKS